MPLSSTVRATPATPDGALPRPPSCAGKLSPQEREPPRDTTGVPWGAFSAVCPGPLRGGGVSAGEEGALDADEAGGKRVVTSQLRGGRVVESMDARKSPGHDGNTDARPRAKRSIGKRKTWPMSDAVGAATRKTRHTPTTTWQVQSLVRSIGASCECVWESAVYQLERNATWKMRAFIADPQNSSTETGFQTDFLHQSDTPLEQR